MNLRYNSFFWQKSVLALIASVLPCFFLQGQRIPENLGPNVNTKFTEILPRISPDGKTLYFVRSIPPSSNGGKDMGQDIWYAELDTNGKFGVAKNIGPPLNTPEHNAVCSVTPDGNTLLLSNTYYPDGRMGVGASISQRTANGWSFPKNLRIRNFHNLSEYVNFYLASDARTMIIEMQDAKSLGYQDLYVSFLEDPVTNTWSEPINLGPDINTAGYEFAPFLAADNMSLYFSSTGWGGHGNADILVARRLDSTWTRWSRPLNLGPEINTPGFDAYLSLPASGDYAYYSSDKGAIGEKDIFRIQLRDELKPLPVVLVNGVVLNSKTKQPIAAEIHYERLSDGKRVGTARSDPNTGAYKIVLLANEKYAFSAHSEGYIGINDHMDLNNLNRYEEVNKNLELVPIEEGQVIRLNNLFFDSGLATLKPESYPEIKRIADLLNKYPKMKIEIAGHTDNTGPENLNIKISQQRANAVKQVLITRYAIAKERVLAQGYGESKPIDTNNTEEGKKRNRRVEFKILEK
ncbi:MAG: OmpA family protein [Bacteroidia bacterium]|nr:OmpA family protein [Bacteroidia bacterium]MDW8159701.1 OmpA family protein [Bacteroidia bacterium]